MITAHLRQRLAPGHEVGGGVVRADGLGQVRAQVLLGGVQPVHQVQEHGADQSEVSTPTPQPITAHLTPAPVSAETSR